MNQNQNQENIKPLDDEQRVKVLSPGMLVVKRFFRNKLAMIGVFILVSMFLFAFVGGAFTPYGESQVFRATEEVLKDYAGVIENKEFQYTVVEGKEFPAAAGSKLILAVNKGEETFEAREVNYSLLKEGEDFYQVVGLAPVAKGISLKGKINLTAVEGATLTEGMKQGFAAAVAAEESTFEADGVQYTISKSGKESFVSTADQIALASKMIFSTYEKEQVLSYEFRLQAERAYTKGETTFEAEDKQYQISVDEESHQAEILLDGKEFATMTKLSIQPVSKDIFLTVDFKQAVAEAIGNEETSLVYKEASGVEAEYVIERKNNQYLIRTHKETQINMTFSKPNQEHWLGTDQNGMDILTRLMYGGRISLLIGFAAIAIEMIIGIAIGGLAGYFGGTTDSVLMRIVDTVNCIPAMPLYIIIGSIMDYYQIDPRIRLYMMCIILGFLSWPAIARMVRGQILSLREQEFMVATEATGVRISRRIFRHLVPNVIPQLIVMATMGLGQMIIMEATLSFLGLGVKFPYASWGSIVNAVNDVYVLTNYWFVWIPAGFLILITVLGFNFVGDGLRDAFDPKMKR